MRKLASVLTVLLVLALVIGVGCDDEDGTPTPAVTSTPGVTSTPTPTSILTPTLTPTPTPTQTVQATLPELRVHFINVGQGDAILLDLGETEVLIDGGKKTSSVISSLSSSLVQHVDGHLEAVIATHPHYDHVGGLVWVLDNYDVDQIWRNDDTNSICDTCKTFRTKSNAEVAVVGVARRGKTITVGPLSFNVLHPTESLASDINNDSIVLKLSYGQVDFLFAGDAENNAESSMLGAGVLTDIDILKVAHHGSDTSSSQAFLSVVQPEDSIIMVGSNSYGHPDAGTISRLDGYGTVWRTDVPADIIVVTDGEQYSVTLAP